MSAKETGAKQDLSGTNRGSWLFVALGKGRPKNLIQFLPTPKN